MTWSNKKKKTPANLVIDKEKDKPEDSVATPKVPRFGAFKTHKPPTVAPHAQVGLLVTVELEKAMEECRTKVAQIVKGCRAVNRRFRDVEFDLENDKIRCLYGLSYDGPEVPPAVLRVTQIFENPQFIIDGADAIDIIQGELGDCWLLSALATMSTSKGLIEKLCISRDEEVGVYGFVFFRGSTWVSVIIDDQLFWSLPKYEELSSEEQKLYRCDRETRKGLHFARSGTEGETWVPLIEKAYAKLHGDYASLSGGLSSEAIEDLTGYVDILDKDRFWKEELLKATQDRLFGCSFAGLDTSRKTELFAGSPDVNGLIGGHAYSILRVKKCKGKRFVVLRNPWGASEWTGAWGDGSKEWVGKWLDVLKELDHVFGDDGEFVMEYSDFLDTFELIERTTIFDSSWVMSSHWLRVPPPYPNHPWTFGDLSFKFTLSRPSFTIIALSQLDDRYFSDISGVSEWNIDFVVYKRGDKEITGVSFHAVVQARSVTCELNLEAGEYIIFPRYDRYPLRSPGYFDEDWDDRKLTRVLTERAQARAIALKYKLDIAFVPMCDYKYFPVSIETLIEEDLEKLESEKQKGVKEDEDSNEEAEEEEEEEENPDEPKKTEGDPEKAEGDPEKTEGDPETGGLDLPEFLGLGPGTHHEDLDCLILGMRIYTKGGVVVSVTGQVFGEEIDDEEEDEEAEAEDKEDE
ncbi:cysteine proteinase [Phlegmacium glaucopus]|nr:cysteine proteinase [Phlegmacium glaucopus]